MSLADDYVPVIDISRYQGVMNFRKMVDHGVVGVIIKLGNGQVLDNNAPKSVNDAQDAGLVVGGYWFANPKADVSGSDQMGRFAGYCRKYGALGIPPMIDVENYTGEPGSHPVLTGGELLSWLQSGANRLEVEFGENPIVYTNGAYFASNHMTAGTLARCPLIVARYPFYYPGEPVPPADGGTWADWVYGITAKRPQLPVGWSDWDGWQFEAGYDHVAGTYGGAAGGDLDLNVVRRASWDRWVAWQRAATAPIVIIPPIIIQTTPPPAAIIPAGPQPIHITPQAREKEPDIMAASQVIVRAKGYNEAFLVPGDVWLTGPMLAALVAAGVPYVDGDDGLAQVQAIAGRSGVQVMTPNGSGA